MRKWRDRTGAAQARANWRAARNDASHELDELRTAVNETARVARSNLLFLLVVGLYLGILVAQTDDVLLLKAGNVDLPIMQVGIPVVTLYAVAPVLFLLLHFNLILRLGQLATALGLLGDRLAPLPAAEQLRQRVMVYPFDFARLVLGHRDGQGTRLLIFGVVLMLVVVLPLLLLLSMQMRFLAYQNEAITLAHQFVVTLDLLVLVTFAAYLARTLGERQSWPGWHWYVRGRAAWATWPAAIVLTFVWTVAIVPGSDLENAIGWRTASATAFGDRWHEHTVTLLPFRRYLDVRGKTIAAEEPLAEEIGGLRARGEDPEQAWDRIDTLDLANRSLRHGVFTSTRFKRVVLRNAELHDANLSEAELHGADLSGAELRGANLVGAALHGAKLRWAELNGADLSDAELHGANLREAELHGADLAYAELHGADLAYAELHGAGLRWAGLHGADLAYAELYGADLAYAELHGADLRWAGLHGADLSWAELHGVDLREAELHGADLSRAELHGADLREAELHGADWGQAELYGADLHEAELHGTSLRRAKLHGADLIEADLDHVDMRDSAWTRPDNWSDIRGNIRSGLRLRRSNEAQIGARLAALDKRATAEHGLAMPDAPSDDACVWRDATGPFESWPEPPETCVKSLVTYVVGVACRNRWTAAAIVRRQVDFWQSFFPGNSFFEGLVGHDKPRDATIIRALLAADQDACPALDQYRDTLQESYLVYEAWLALIQPAPGAGPTTADPTAP